MSVRTSLRDAPALRQEGHVDVPRLAFTTDMALLTEGELVPLAVYKHGPPGGGRMSKLECANPQPPGWGFQELSAVGGIFGER